MIARTADEIAPWTEVPDAVWRALRGILAPYVGATFTIHDNPKRKERPRGLKTGGVYTPPATKAAEKVVVQHFQQVMPGWEPEPDLTYGLLVEFVTTEGSKVDVDNCLKLVMDALNKTMWLDDIQVGATFCYISRGRGEPRTEVELFAWQNNGTPKTKLCTCGVRFRAKETLCADCRKNRTAVNQLLAIGAAEDSAAELAVLKRKAYRFIVATWVAADTSPSTKTIAEKLDVTEHRARAVISALVTDGILARDGRKLRVVKQMGTAA